MLIYLCMSPNPQCTHATSYLQDPHVLLNLPWTHIVCDESMTYSLIPKVLYNSKSSTDHLDPGDVGKKKNVLCMPSVWSRHSCLAPPSSTAKWTMDLSGLFSLMFSLFLHHNLSRHFPCCSCSLHTILSKMALSHQNSLGKSSDVNTSYFHVICIWYIPMYSRIRLNHIKPILIHVGVAAVNQ